MGPRTASTPGPEEIPQALKSSLWPGAGGSSGKSRPRTSPSTTSAPKASPCICASPPPRQTPRQKA
eukprot:11348922-Alexandrium_andersonii.AAC.1